MKGTGRVSYPVTDLSTIQKGYQVANFIWAQTWLLEYRIKVLENRVLRRILKFKGKAESNLVEKIT
jgi:hypothetical protein